MPEVKILAPSQDFVGIVRDQSDTVVDLHGFANRRIKRATRIGQRVAVHLVGAAPGDLLIFENPTDYEQAICREFLTS